MSSSSPRPREDQTSNLINTNITQNSIYTKTNDSLPVGESDACSEDSENINYLVQAYSTIPLIASLTLGFSVTASCQSALPLVAGVTSVLTSASIGSALLAITSSTIFIYHILYILANVGSNEARCYINRTKLMRSMARGSTYFSLFAFVISHITCTVATASSIVGTFIVCTQVLFMLVVVFAFLIMRNEFQKITKPHKKLKGE